ncbi:MAG: ketopantoate reductase family protein [Rhodomicrobium sp.]
MDILIVGTGIIGTIYGWAFKEAGLNVAHWVRPGRKAGLSQGIRLDVLDMRKNHPHRRATIYYPEALESLPDGRSFGLVLVATKHYQAAAAVAQLKDLLPHALFLMFCANWDGPGEIESLIPGRHLWGYPVASGGYEGETLMASMLGRVQLGECKGGESSRLTETADLFTKAGMRVEIQENIIHWLWVHHAINGGTLGATIAAGGLRPMARSWRWLKTAGAAGRDALRVAEKKGVDLNRFEQARIFMKWPAWLGIPFYAYMLNCTEHGKRTLEASHFDHSPEEMKRYFFDVLNTARALGFAVPHLNELEPAVQAWKAEV